MKKLLLHICCGVCASFMIERLREEGFEPIGFFYNPNIHPEEEYKRRFEAVTLLARALGFSLIEGEVNRETWFKLTEGLEREPERGRRCEVCFRMRLTKSSQKAKELKLPFATTLTVSPHKNSELINSLGRELTNFLSFDFKGYSSKRYNLYRQNYCGCIYSLK